jgi:cephalosporin hydroxylase
MKLLINTKLQNIKLYKEKKKFFFNLYTKKAFNILSNFWMEYAWNQKYTYRFTWLGYPIIQLPDDIINIQELIYKEKPKYIIETGVAHGGSIVFYASIAKLLNLKKVIGIEKKIRKKNLIKLKKSPLKNFFQIIEGDSTSPKIVKKVSSIIKKEKTLVILDSNHSFDHVYKELISYSNILKKNSFIIATDGIVDVMKFAPRRFKYNKKGGPVLAIKKFLVKNKKFEEFLPTNLFNESKVDKNLTHWQNGWLKKIKN